MSAAPLNRDAIAERIPHCGNMVMLDTVEHWDNARIECLSYQHLSEDNPLKENGSLSTITLVEFAAQAAALHASLNAQGIDGQGTAFIGAIKALTLHQEKVPAVNALRISAELVLNESSGAIYQLSAATEGEGGALISARVVLVIPDHSK